MSNPSVPNPMADTPASPPAAAASSSASAMSNESKPPAQAAKTATPQQQALQQQIQAQLQSQLQAQLQAAAAKGKQANITPEMIQVGVIYYIFLLNMLLRSITYHIIYYYLCAFSLFICNIIPNSFHIIKFHTGTSTGNGPSSRSGSSSRCRCQESRRRTRSNERCTNRCPISNPSSGNR